MPKEKIKINFTSLIYGNNGDHVIIVQPISPLITLVYGGGCKLIVPPSKKQKKDISGLV